MKRRVWKSIREATNMVVHGSEIKSSVLVEETGTFVSAIRTGEHSFRLNVLLRGDDR